MQMKSDAQLLRDYASHGDEAAFREIVARHADLVYSAALRQVESPDLAGDVAQSVFVDLARKAKSVGDRLSADASLTGWLYRSTRYTALNHLRDTRRRVTHERLAMEQLIANSEVAPDWEQIRPALDEVMSALDDDDREALLLRYFKNQDFRAVGLALGISDDAAQKRVSRAVERLRELFAKRGVTVGAGGLVIVIAANAVQAAPVGLVATISTAALAGTAITTTIATAAKAIAMTTLQKTIIVAAIAASVATPLVIQHQNITRLREEKGALRQQADQLAELRAENERLSNQVAQANTTPALSDAQLQELVRLRGEVTRLRDMTNAIGQLREENRQLQARQAVRPESSAAQSPPDVPPQDIYARASWKNAGFADARSAFQTSVWALANGDAQTYGASLSPDMLQAKKREIADRMQLTGKSHDDLAADSVKEFSPVTGYRVVDEKDISDDQVILDVYLDGVGTQTAVRMKKIGDEWKLDAAP
jgi:RNA polymerase sigma factor (sigma-70 family)